MQSQTGGAASILFGFAARFAIVPFFAADRVAQLGQVNANLMRPAGLQPAAQHRIAGQLFNKLNVRDGLLADARQLGAAAAAVAAISDQAGGNALRWKRAGNDRQISGQNRVGTKLLSQSSFGRDRAGADDPDAGLFVDTVDDAQPRRRAFAVAAIF